MWLKVLVSPGSDYRSAQFDEIHVFEPNAELVESRLRPFVHGYAPNTTSIHAAAAGVANSYVTFAAG